MSAEVVENAGDMNTFQGGAIPTPIANPIPVKTDWVYVIINHKFLGVAAADFGNQIGLGGILDPPVPLDVLVQRLAQATGQSPVRVLAHGPAEASQVGCISGGAAPRMEQVADAGFDTFVTGETSHGYFHNAAEYGLNVIYGGHYATETLGVKALARHLGKKFGLETTFLDIPTGM